VRFVEDNWENPALGAWGLGWEVWMDGARGPNPVAGSRARPPKLAVRHAACSRLLPRKHATGLERARNDVQACKRGAECTLWQEGRQRCRDMRCLLPGGLPA